jgi:hypothetical protein
LNLYKNAIIENGILIYPVILTAERDHTAMLVHTGVIDNRVCRIGAACWVRGLEHTRDRGFRLRGEDVFPAGRKEDASN